MPVLKTLTKLLLYQKPQSPSYDYESGIEDRFDSSDSKKINNREKDKSEEQKGTEDKTSGADEKIDAVASNNLREKLLEAGNQPDKEGIKAGGRRSLRKRKKPRNNKPVQEKYAGKVAVNQSIDEILHKKVKLSYDLKENRLVLEKIFRVPDNKDAVLRSFSIGTKPPTQALLIFIDGITNSQVQNTAVLQPLMLLSGLRDIPLDKIQDAGSEKRTIYKDFFDRVKQAILPNNQVSEADTFNRIVEDILSGNSVLLIDGYNQALMLETKGWQYRNVSTPQVEAVINGPQEGFTEMLRVNTSLIRKIIQKPALITEFIQVGSSSPTQVAIMYMDNIVNPDIIKEVKRRLSSIKGDYLQQTGLVEQMIEDAPFYPAPQVLSTERPDRVAANLEEGKIAILVGSNPFVMVVPCTFFDLMQSPEDAYVRWPFGSFARLIRYFGLFVALLLPAHYVAIVAYHQEFIPTDLLLAIAGSRERVPFPSIVEILIMETSFELIREAGVRVPGTVGTTLGIVGALILGQAAVAANIVSPILIIVVAVTALGSFAIPNYSFSLSIRVLRFVYIILASLFGLLGILIGVFIHVGLMVNLKSFGVPFMAPAAPVTNKGRDYWMRGMIWQQQKRPDYLDPLKPKRQPQISRRWLYPDDGGGGEKQ
ncbi:spore germination protein [Desulfoscipio sp. XC116]|uniref:spore germination protein n=1 Tax=Desulfoscipio sp. XC116 TaxID=3144975 RepID=UPI00325A7A95